MKSVVCRVVPGPSYHSELTQTVCRDIINILGLSERLEVQEMFENLQEERLDNLQDDLVTCINGDEGQGGEQSHIHVVLCRVESELSSGDDQDLDDRVIKKLWEENQELRDQVNLLRNGQTQADEG